MHATDGALGRNWMFADRAELRDFGDCFRATLFWNDGESVYFLEDTRDEAVHHLNRLGFFEEVKA